MERFVLVNHEALSRSEVRVKLQLSFDPSRQQTRWLLTLGGGIVQENSTNLIEYFQRNPLIAQQLEQYLLPIIEEAGGRREILENLSLELEAEIREGESIRDVILRYKRRGGIIPIP